MKLRNNFKKSSISFFRRGIILVVSFLLLAYSINLPFINIELANAALDQWETITPSGTSGYIFKSIASAGDYVFLATDHGVYKSTNKGVTWNKINGLPGTQNSNYIMIAYPYDGASLGYFSYDDNTYVYAGTDSGVYRTTLSGSSWTNVSTGLANAPVSDIEVDLYKNVAGNEGLGGDTSTIYASVNTAISSEKGVYRSDNNGDNWTLENTNWPDEKAVKLASYTDYGGYAYIYAISDQNRLYNADMASFNSGSDEDWSDRLIYDGGSTVLNDISINYLTLMNAYLSTSNGIFVNNDPYDPTTWTAANDGLTNLNIKTVDCYDNGANILYAASAGGGIYKSVDSATSWIQINKNLPELNIKDVKIDQFLSSSNTYLTYAVGQTGVYKLESNDVESLPVNTDITVPSKIVSLQSGSLTMNTVELLWTATGDDGDSGAASSYDIRYGITPIDDAIGWNNATQATGEPIPQEAGSDENFTVTGLNPNTKYYFYIKAIDDAGNPSDISNEVWSITNGTDSIAPATITNLAISQKSTTTVTIQWTAVGDDGITGTASSYDIRYASSSIADANWGLLTIPSGVPTPEAPGTIQSLQITGLTPGLKYYFAIRVFDENANYSESNIASTTMTSTADINTDGRVNSVDASILMSYWGYTTKPKADINQDGNVNLTDAAIMMSQWTN